MSQTDVEIRRAVRERYAKLASEGRPGGSCGCGSSMVELGVPPEAAAIYAGCGSPLKLIELKEGDVVLDLGSGGGVDVFRASESVGEKGRAIGVDATQEMVLRARETASKYGKRNVEFRLGEIEHLPIESDSVDYVISNCVINLSPDKQQVIGEAFRVLKPGGTFALADITTTREGAGDPEGTDLKSWASCVSGAISIQEYRQLLRKAGFSEIDSKSSTRCDCGAEDCDCNPGEAKVQSSHIIARKPKVGN